MIRWNVSKSNEAIDREQAIADLRKLTRHLQWHSLHHRGARSGTLAVIAIDLLLVCLASSQGRVSNP